MRVQEVPVIYSKDLKEALDHILHTVPDANIRAYNSDESTEFEVYDWDYDLNRNETKVTGILLYMREIKK